jgi:hypothetical protein
MFKRMNICLIYFLLLCLTLSSYLTSCSTPDDVSSIKPIKVDNAGSIVMLSEGEAVRDLILSNAESELAWRQKQARFPVGGEWSTWLAQFTLAADEQPATPSGLIILPPQQVSYGRLLVSNVFHKPHSLALVFLLDYQPLSVQSELDMLPAYYVSEMPVGAEHAFEFLIPPIPHGFHHLSILLITDPKSTSTDIDYRQAQQRSFSEQRFDLWVGINEIPDGTPSFPSIEQAVAAGGYRSTFEVVHPDDPDREIERLELEAGVDHVLALRFNQELPTVNLEPYTGTLPIRIGIFWNDHLQDALDYEFDPQLTEPIVFPINIHVPPEPATYQLQVVAFQIPWHAQFNAEEEWIAFGKAAFSRRMLVEVGRDKEGE